MWLPLLVLLGLCLVFFVSLKFEPRNELPSPLIDKPLPWLDSTNLLTGELTKQEDLPSEPFLINVWATWCFPCREEHPVLLAMAAEGVEIVGLNYKDENDKAIDWLNSMGDAYRLNLVDPQGSYGIELGVYGVPATYFVDVKDAEKTIRYKHIGPITEQQWENQLRSIYQSLLDEEIRV